MPPAMTVGALHSRFSMAGASNPEVMRSDLLSGHKTVDSVLSAHPWGCHSNRIVSAWHCPSTASRVLAADAPDVGGTERSPPVFAPCPRLRPTARRCVAHGIRLTAYGWRVPDAEERAATADGVADAKDCEAVEDCGEMESHGDAEDCGDAERCGDAWSVLWGAGVLPEVRDRPFRVDRAPPDGAGASTQEIAAASHHHHEPEAPTRSRGRLRLGPGSCYRWAGGAACPEGAFFVPGTRTRSTSRART